MHSYVPQVICWSGATFTAFLAVFQLSFALISPPTVSEVKITVGWITVESHTDRNVHYKKRIRGWSSLTFIPQLLGKHCHLTTRSTWVWLVDHTEDFVFSLWLGLHRDFLCGVCMFSSLIFLQVLPQSDSWYSTVLQVSSHSPKKNALRSNEDYILPLRPGVRLNGGWVWVDEVAEINDNDEWKNYNYFHIYCTLQLFILVSKLFCCSSCSYSVMKSFISTAVLV